MTELYPTVHETAEALLSLSALLNEADEAQWQRARVILPDGAEDTGIRSQGEHSDPTADTVADAGRLRLRAAVIESEDVLKAFHRAANVAGRRLQRAIDTWNGGL